MQHLRSLAAHSSDPITAAVVDWWVQRADHPGTTCTYIASNEAAKRWVTGLAPEQEEHPQVWGHWLGLPSTNTPAQNCEAIIRATAAGTPLEGLQECHGSDLSSWKYLIKRNLTRHRPGKESQRDAAMGLVTRSQAAEYYESMRLSDPLVAQSAALSGHLVQGTVTQHGNNVLEIVANTAISRFRVGAEVQAWHGPVGSATRTVTVRAGHITSIAITAAQQLNITIENTVVVAPLVTGDTLTLRPRIVDPHQQSRLRSRYSARLRDQRNWVSRALPPPTQRRTVPMDVVIAAAPDGD